MKLLLLRLLTLAGVIKPKPWTGPVVRLDEFYREQ